MLRKLKEWVLYIAEIRNEPMYDIAMTLKRFSENFMFFAQDVADALDVLAYQNEQEIIRAYNRGHSDGVNEALFLGDDEEFHTNPESEWGEDWISEETAYKEAKEYVESIESLIEG